MRFISCLHRRDYYKQCVAAAVQRNNSINGRNYSHDPTIFGWDLMNEPRCEVDALCAGAQLPSGVDAVAAWAADVASYMRSLGPRQPLTLVLDGFLPVSMLHSTPSPAPQGTTWTG